FYFFFSSRRRHTRFSRDWSSDVCSSDLKPRPALDRLYRLRLRALSDLCRDDRGNARDGGLLPGRGRDPCDPGRCHHPHREAHEEIGRASCREREYMSAVTVALEQITEQE